MKSRILESNSFTIKHEPRHDGNAPETVPELIELINNDPDAPDIYSAEPTGYGYEIEGWTNGAPRIFEIDALDLADFAEGKTVLLICKRDAELFELPPYSRFSRWYSTGEPSTIYVLESQPEAEQIERMTAAGCHMVRFGPEGSKSEKPNAVLVPDSVPHGFAA